MLSAKERLEKRLEALNHVAKKSLGQNFLISDHVIDKIIQSTIKISPQSVIEIGPGLGALTDILIRGDFKYQAIELDKSIFEYWKQQNIEIINEDALKIDWKNIQADTLVSNLPYQISSSIVIERSINPHMIRHMVLMFQKEVAQRIRAREKTEEYGMLSVIAQEFWNIETVCEAGPKDFSPAPKVASRVLKFSAKQSEIENRPNYLKFVKMCFQQRRRILKSNVSSNYFEAVMQWVSENKLSEKVRAEELSPEQFKKMYLFSKNNEKIKS